MALAWWGKCSALLRGVVSGRHRERAWYVSVVTSTVLHLSLVTLMSVWVLARVNRGDPGLVDTRWSPHHTLQPEELTEEAEFEVAKSSINAGGAAAPLQVRPAQEITIQDVSLPTRAVARSGFQADSVLTGDSLNEDVGEPISLDDLNALNGKGLGGGAGEGDGEESGFFGINPQGERFVYVVDGSRSMNHPHESAAKTRFRRLKIELVRSISRLHPDQQFYIIFFNQFPISMPAPGLQHATRDAQLRYLNWMTTVRADGDTDPRLALAAAFRMRPDTVFFLTDGSFTAKVQKDLRKLRGLNITLHTYAFGNRAAESLLKTMAESNGGKYRYIP